MKNLLFTLLFFVTFSTLHSQDKYEQDVVSMEAIIDALYDVISGPAGEKRDTARMKYLFIPDAKLMPTYIEKQTGETRLLNWSLQDYFEKAIPVIEKQGFYEKEITRTVEYYGTIAHVFSTYETRKNADDDIPSQRGINSIQLLKGKDRWYIVSIYWFGESEDFPIPEKYLD